MPTNEERREVAANIRRTNFKEGFETVQETEGLEPAAAIRFVAWPNLVSALNIGKPIVSMHEVTERLACLIEPEERTCKYIWDEHDHVWKCSECGGLEPCSDSVNYCCDCGAKVVE